MMLFLELKKDNRNLDLKELLMNQPKPLEIKEMDDSDQCPYKIYKNQLIIMSILQPHALT